MLHRAASRDAIAEGTGIAVSVGGREIAVFNLGGEFYAIDNTCPHRGGGLGEGAVEGENVICPLHGWEFNIKTGKLPMGEGVGAHRVVVEGEDVLVEL